MERTAEWGAGGEAGRRGLRKEQENGGPQRVLLSSLQGLCSAELICCEMCKRFVDRCLVCSGDWVKEEASGWVWRSVCGGGG